MLLLVASLQASATTAFCWEKEFISRASEQPTATAAQSEAQNFLAEATTRMERESGRLSVLIPQAEYASDLVRALADNPYGALRPEVQGAYEAKADELFKQGRVVREGENGNEVEALEGKMVKDSHQLSQQIAQAEASLSQQTQQAEASQGRPLSSSSIVSPDLPEEWGGRPKGSSRRAQEKQKEWDDQRAFQIASQSGPEAMQAYMERRDAEKAQQELQNLRMRQSQLQGQIQDMQWQQQQQRSEMQRMEWERQTESLRSPW